MMDNEASELWGSTLGGQRGTVDCDTTSHVMHLTSNRGWEWVHLDCQPPVALNHKLILSRLTISGVFYRRSEQTASDLVEDFTATAPQVVLELAGLHRLAELLRTSRSGSRWEVALGTPSTAVTIGTVSNFGIIADDEKTVLAVQYSSFLTTLRQVLLVDTTTMTSAADEIDDFLRGREPQP